MNVAAIQGESMTIDKKKYSPGGFVCFEAAEIKLLVLLILNDHGQLMKI